MFIKSAAPMKWAIFLLALVLATSSHGGSSTIQLGSGDGFTVQDSAGTPFFSVDSAGNMFPGENVYEQTVIVGPVGTETQNGTALLDAMAGIVTASATNPILLHIEPGIYDLGTDMLEVTPHVDVRGSGQGNTIIRRSGGPDVFEATTVYVLDQSQVSNLAIENTGGASTATGYNAGGHSTIRDVTIRVSGASSFGYGVYASFCDSILVDGVTIEATGNDGGSWAVSLISCDRAEVSDSIVAGTGGSLGNFGITTNSQETLIENVVATASGSGQSDGLSTQKSNTVVRHSRFEGASSGSSSYGMRIVDDGGAAALYTVEVQSSQLSGQTGAANSTTETDAVFGASQLDGGVAGTGNKTCAGVYDGAFVLSAGSCP